MLIANRTESSLQISVIGEIMGENDWTVSDAVYLRELLDGAGGTPIDMWISSPGGSLDAALAMRAMIAATQATVLIHTAGIVASAATMLLCIPQAKIIAERGSVFMIHTSSTATCGNADDIQKAADVLRAFDDEVINVYKLRMKCGDDEIRKMLSEETWLKPEEALSLGLIDEIANGTSGGFIAEPENPEPLPEAVSARLEPRISAICSGLDNLKTEHEMRFTALNMASVNAASEISDASCKAVSDIRASVGDMTEVFTEALKAIREELAEVRAMYEESKEKYRALDSAISQAYGLCGGDVSRLSAHDESRVKSTFKLNI